MLFISKNEKNIFDSVQNVITSVNIALNFPFSLCCPFPAGKILFKISSNSI